MAKTFKDRKTLFDEVARLTRKAEKAYRSAKRARRDKLSDRTLRREAEAEYDHLKSISN